MSYQGSPSGWGPHIVRSRAQNLGVAREGLETASNPDGLRSREDIPETYRKLRNKDGHTPYELFSKNNQVLISQSLEWMKDCMVVATLIVTVAFAVAFTVPGGYNQDQGRPIYIHDPMFLIFVFADAISLFASSTSLLVFLSLLTSRHGPCDYMYSLPRKLMTGLVTLFISVVAMVTFSASFFVLYRNGLQWVPILIDVLAAIPVIIFAALQGPLYVDMFRSLYDSRYLFNPRRHVLYNDVQYLKGGN
ncbi:ankyrin repeat-containing protein NPR4-like [Rutidosis leptorrhynchoides]|uniref:ankyrin repeat-containing protein NPR4-like n=1 Tax=Rutidosis leptorrhynchoides TaxID=125765 RepID=UPI003A9A507F